MEFTYLVFHSSWALSVQEYQVYCGLVVSALEPLVPGLLQISSKRDGRRGVRNSGFQRKQQALEYLSECKLFIS